VTTISVYDSTISTTVLGILRSGKLHSYKMVQMVQELAEDDPDRRIQFFGQMMTLIDNNQMSLTSIRFPVKSSGFFKSLPSFGGDVKLSVPATYLVVVVRSC
jgi:hypothetical protein